MNDRMDKIAQAGEIMRQSDIELGMQVERARIVSLIKSFDCPHNGVEHDCAKTLEGVTVGDLIVLIKEGTND